MIGHSCTELELCTLPCWTGACCHTQFLLCSCVLCDCVVCGQRRASVLRILYRCTNTANGNYMQSNAGLVPSAYPLCSGQQAQHIALAASYSGADVHQASIKPGAADAEGYPGSLQAVPEI